MKRRLKRLCALIAVLTLLCTGANAAVVTGLDDMPGDGQYMSDEYVENYAIDSEKLGFLGSFEKIGLGVVNVLFSLCRYIVFLGLCLFRFALTLNVGELMGGRLDAIQTAIKDSIFEPMYTVAFIGIAVALIKKLLQRNVSGIMAELGKVVVIYLFVSLLAQNTSGVLGGTVSIARDLGLSVVVEMNGRDADGDPSGFVDETVGILWGDLVHKPWENLEFDGCSHTDADVRAILSEKPGSDARQDAVDAYIAAHPGAMSKGGAWRLIAVVLLYMIPTVVKLAVYVICAVVVIAFQLLAIFYALTGVIILLLAMFESLGGLYLIGDWLKRMLETQLMVLITTMLLGFIVLFGSVMDGLGGTLGWLGGLLFQSAVIVALFSLRKQLLHGFQRVMENPRASARQFAGASPVSVASELPAAYAGAYLGGGTQQARMTRLDRREQKSRIELNNAQSDFYGAENDRATAERDLALKRQLTEDYRIGEAEARRTKRVAKEEARAHRQAERKAQETENRETRPQDTADARQPTTGRLSPASPGVERPLAALPPHTPESETSATAPATQSGRAAPYVPYGNGAAQRPSAAPELSERMDVRGREPRRPTTATAVPRADAKIRRAREDTSKRAATRPKTAESPNPAGKSEVPTAVRPALDADHGVPEPTGTKRPAAQSTQKNEQTAE